MVKAAIRDLDALRRYLGENAPFLGGRAGQETGIQALDRLLEGRGGLPRGALTVLSGAPGSGRASLAARILSEETRAGRPVAWVDVRRTLYPPALDQAGLDLERLLVVRTDPERSVYAGEQLLGSSLFRVVVLSGLERHLSSSRTRRLQTAAETAETVGLILQDPSTALRLTGVALELEVTRRAHGVRVTVLRDRLGPSGKKATIPFEAKNDHLAA